MSCGPRRAAGRPLGSSGAAADCSCAWGSSTLPRAANLIMPFRQPMSRKLRAHAVMCEHLPISDGAGAPHLYEFPLMGTWLPRTCATARPQLAKADTAFQSASVGQPTEPCLGKLGYGGHRHRSSRRGRRPSSVESACRATPSTKAGCHHRNHLAGHDCAQRAKLKIPVVFAFVRDPVGLGIVESFSHPGGDFTGVTYGEAGIGRRPRMNHP